MPQEARVGKLDGKVAVITGASSGIGLAAAKLFTAEGAFVFMMARRPDVLDRAATEVGGDVCPVAGDVADPAAVDALYDRVRDMKGHVDVVWAHAGMGEYVPLEQQTQEQLDRVFDVNVKGTVYTVQKALPLLRDNGAVILTGSVAAHKATGGLGVYAGSKAAVRAFGRNWAVELAPRNIRVNVITPGAVDTGAYADAGEQERKGLAKLAMLRRMGQAEELARVGLFLASDDSSFVTGAELLVDGGTAQL